jgi:regulator of sigma E protease
MAEVTGAPDEFMSKPRWQRAIILVAGVTMNVVLALVLLFGLFTIHGVTYSAYSDLPIEIAVLPADSPAQKAGIQPGDRVVELGDLKEPNWGQAEDYLSDRSHAEIPLVVERDARQVRLTVKRDDAWRTDELKRINGVIGYAPLVPVIDQIAPGTPAAAAGLKTDDRIVAVDGQKMEVWGEVQRRIRESHGRPIQLTIQRGNQELSVEVQPVQTRRNVWQIGLTNQIETRSRKLGPAEAVEMSVATTTRMMGEILRVVGGLIKGEVSLRELGGPVEIARQSGRAARQGIAHFVSLMILISLNLAVLNLLPIPILDGGHILMLGIEGLRRRDLSLAIKERFMQVGFVVLMLIFIFVMYNDIFNRAR